VHASASSFKAFAERHNWLEVSMSSDVFSLGMLKAGIPEKTIKEWCVDPQVVIGGRGEKGSIFDQLEDLDTKPCLQKIQTLFQLQPKTLFQLQPAAKDAKASSSLLTVCFVSWSCLVVAAA